MARTRLDFHILMKSLCDNVYFQPPPSTKMRYPAIIYTRNRDWRLNANNSKYLNMRNYQLTVIDRDPDSVLSDRVSELPMCSFDRSFTSDNLNHFVYTIYF